jgi:hypothetical protein
MRPRRRCPAGRRVPWPSRASRPDTGAPVRSRSQDGPPGIYGSFSGTCHDLRPATSERPLWPSLDWRRATCGRTLCVSRGLCRAHILAAAADRSANCDDSTGRWPADIAFPGSAGRCRPSRPRNETQPTYRRNENTSKSVNASVKTTHEGIGAINAAQGAVQMDEPERPDRDAATMTREIIFLVALGVLAIGVTLTFAMAGFEIF